MAMTKPLSEQVRFTQDGIGAVERLASEKLKEWVSVKDFGAVGDGKTDDYPAILAAYSFAASSGGGALFFPKGTYKVNTTLQISASNIHIEGASSSSSIILNGIINAPAIQIGDGVTGIYSCSVAKLGFAGADGVTAVAGNCGLSVKKLGHGSFSDLRVSRYPAKLYDGLTFSQLTQSPLAGIQVQESARTGVILDRCNDVYMVNSRSDANGVTGFSIVDSNGVFFTNVSAYGNLSRAWSLTSTGINNNKNHFYTNCIGDTSGEINWYIAQLYQSVFTACWGSTQLDPAAFTYASGFFLDGPSVKDLLFSGCFALYNNSHGVHIGKATRVTFRDLVAGDSTNGNGRSGTGSGVFLDADASEIRFLGGSFTNNAEYAAAVSSTTSVIFDGCDMAGNTLGVFAPGSIGGTKIARSIKGHTPLSGAVTTPAIPASGATLTNTTGVDCQVAVLSGTVSAIYIDGAYSFNQTGAVFVLRAGSSIRLDYTVAPVWKWLGI